MGIDGVTVMAKVMARVYLAFKPVTVEVVVLLLFFSGLLNPNMAGVPFSFWTRAPIEVHHFFSEVPQFGSLRLVLTHKLMLIKVKTAAG